MGCRSCGAENPLTSKFCQECGARLGRRCPGCGLEVGALAKFCGECGGPLEPALTTSGAPSVASVDPQTYTPRHLAQKILASREGLSGERKQVTVLFADIVGSTELIRDRDPEDAQQLLDGVVQLMMDAVHRYEGTVSRLMGDGLMAMFGAPIAHEDHAVRACYAALALLEAARRHSEQVRRTHGMTVAVRVGISSGEVVVRTIRDDLHMDYTAMGQTVHLASRMEGIAEPGTAVLSAEALALVEGYVQVRALGPVPVKGLAEPADVYQLLGAGQARTRLQVSAARGLTRFVGRDSEMTALYRALDRAATGQGQLAALVGEPGVGKSRLVWELTHSHRIQDWQVLESGSVSYGKATSYLPVIDLLKAYCRIETVDDARAIREKVTGKLLTLDEGLRPILAPVLSLLDIASNDLDWDSLDPAQRRRQTLDAVRRLLLRESQAQPLLLVFEDLHWIDAETQALLDGLTESLPTARMLLLVNYRPEYTHRWGSRTFYTQVRIDPLGEASADELLAGLIGDHASLEPLKGLLTTRTDGNPLFLEESVRSLVETGALVGERGAYQLPNPVMSLQVPSTVQAVLASRIDRLPSPDKQLLQMAAVIGKDVPDALLRAIADRTDDDLQRALATLQAAEFVYQARLFPELEYTFKHALTHEVAYTGLLQEQRRTFHARVVDAIEAVYIDRLHEQTERLAYHAMRGEVWQKAVLYAQQAANRATMLSAYPEAAEFFDQAVRALDQHPQDQRTLERAIDLRLDFQQALIPLAEFQRIRMCLHEAHAMAEQLGDRSRLGKLAFARTHCLWNLGDYDRAIEAAQEALAHAVAVGDTSLQIATTYLVSYPYRDQGQYQRAIDGLRPTVDVLAGPLAGERFGLAGYPGLMSRSILSGCLVELGQFDEATEHARTVLRAAEDLNHPYSLTTAYGGLGRLLLRRGHIGEATALLERALVICEQWSLFHHLPRLVLELGHARLLSGQIESALPLLERTGRLLTDLTWGREASRIGSMLAEGYLRAGQPDEATQLAMRALDIAVTHGERGSQAWGLHTLAEIATQRTRADMSEAEALYHEALALAEELGMRPLQAHCHLSLGKVYSRKGQLPEAEAELQTAITMLREMDMTYWLPEAENELARVSTV